MCVRVCVCTPRLTVRECECVCTPRLTVCVCVCVLAALVVLAYSVEEGVIYNYL